MLIESISLVVPPKTSWGLLTYCVHTVGSGNAIKAGRLFENPQLNAKVKKSFLVGMTEFLLRTSFDLQNAWQSS